MLLVYEYEIKGCLSFSLSEVQCVLQGLVML